MLNHHNQVEVKIKLTSEDAYERAKTAFANLTESKAPLRVYEQTNCFFDTTDHNMYVLCFLVQSIFMQFSPSSHVCL